MTKQPVISISLDTFLNETRSQGRHSFGLEELKQALLKNQRVWIEMVQWPSGISGARDFFLTHGAEEFEALRPKPPPQADPALAPVYELA